MTQDLGRYLGVPSLHGRITKDHCKNIMDRVQSRLEGWKTRFLSLAGRQVLVQSVLNAIPTYAMQTMLIPKGVCDAIDKTTRNFLWGGDGTVRKTSMINWNTVTLPKKEGGLGIKSMRSLNMALLSKLGWRLLNEENNTWAKVLTCKYMKSEAQVMNIKRKRSDSNVWKGICAAAPTIEKGVIKVVKNGKNTSFWNDRWVGNDKLRNHMIGPLNKEADNLKVAECWNEQGTWDWTKIDIAIHPNKRSEIAAKVILNDAEKTDKIGWGHSAENIFSTKSAYDLIRQENRNEESNEWHNIWKLRVPNRIRSFIWLVKHDRIMCNAERKKRGFTSDERCIICGADKEDVDHTLRKCPIAEAVWTNINIGDKSGTSNPLDFNNWLTRNVTGTGDDQRSKKRKARCAITIWWIWKWRNDVIFNGTNRDVKDKVEWLHNQFKEVEGALERNEGPTVRTRREDRRAHPWTPPEANWIKINTDGCVSKQNHATSGGVFRNSDAVFLGAFAGKNGMCTPLEAELWGMHTGLNQAWEKGYRRVELETDCAKAVKLVNDSEDYEGTARNLVELCRNLKKRRWDVKINYIPREQNRVADAFAKRGQNQHEDYRWVDDPPLDIMPLLRQDEIGLLDNATTVRVSY